MSTFIAPNASVNLGDYFANKMSDANFAAKVHGFYVGQNLKGDEVFRAYGTNLTFEDGNKVSIPGDLFDIRKVRRELSHLLRTRLREVIN